MIDKINVRVYVALLKDKKILGLHEEYVGQQLLKLPGGGLEFGESVLECLQRELEEELNIIAKNITHLYTQEDFIVSKFRDNEQLLSIYYEGEIADEKELLIMDPCIEKLEWISLSEENPFLLPVDKVVFELLQKKYL
ncbi:NUDIX hydrolase [Chryseobacterium sp. H3056]|uniref:NUDIX hydrolase n=1 Tax=Kaistella daneshvariae TaxID=2487074 RepID=A0A3N0WZR4_9FLAO|nr:NUDIX hydrolase [Kaistella daneshvariae]ROI10572.1 NUDIX hydrolase [Kaistella daneshvariae]